MQEHQPSRSVMSIAPRVLGPFLLGWGLLVSLPAGGADGLATARALVGSGNPDSARAILDSLLAASDSLSAETRTEAYYLRTVLEDDGAAFAEGLRSLLEENATPDRLAWIHLSLGKIDFSEGNLKEAVSHFQEAAKAGLREEGRLWEGLALYALGDGAGARAALEPVRSSGNRNLRQRALVIMGDTYREAKAWESARGYYHEVREEDGPGSGWWATAVFREAECLEQMGNAAEHASALSELVARAPHSYEGPMARARLSELNTIGEPPLTAAEEEAADAPPDHSPATGFSIQVGAFGSEENAATLAQEVEQAGFARVRVTRGEDNLFRVLVGRVPQRTDAEALGDSLGAALGLGFSVIEER